MDEQTEKKVRKTARMLKYMFLRVEVIIGIFAMIAGAVVTVMVWSTSSVDDTERKLLNLLSSISSSSANSSLW